MARSNRSPMVNASHRRIVGRLVLFFGRYAELRGGDFGPEGRVGLDSGDYFLPDAAFWLAGVDSGDDSIPTVAVEVRSPDQSLTKLRAKCRGYLRDGSSAAWLIDPQKQTVEVFEGTVVRTLKVGETLTCDAMPGFELPLDKLFAAV